ncbi:MAG: efflux RND transporter periplasmic adaptor subunit [Planctomycetota bacterium]
MSEPRAEEARAAGSPARGADLLWTLGGVALLALGFGAVVLADRRGWLPFGASAAQAQACPHGLTPAECPFCTPARVAQGGTCGEHGVPEALCTRCKPALIPAFQAQHDWCQEHGVPESQCLSCDPSRAPRDPGPDTPPPPAAIALVEAGEETPRSARPPSPSCATESLRIRFASARTAAEAGLEYFTVVARAVPLTLTCTAELDFDQNHYARVAARAPAIVAEVARDLGDRVAAGELLARVSSSELGAAKGELLQALQLEALWARNHAREQRLLEQRLTRERDALEAETELAQSRVRAAAAAQRLRTLGLSAAQVAAVASGDTSTLLPVTAPFAGVVVARDAVLGEVARPDRPLFAVAETATLWARLDVREADLRRVRAGLAVTLRVEGLPGEAFHGRLTWVGAALDRRTRTLPARAELPNPRGLLRAGMFGQAVVQVAAPAQRTLVPKAAVQWEGCCNVVFVRRSERLFEPRKVRLGPEAGEQWVVEAGLRPGETVVTTGSFLLKTEVLKGSIGAGCCAGD